LRRSRRTSVRSTQRRAGAFGVLAARRTPSPRQTLAKWRGVGGSTQRRYQRTYDTGWRGSWRSTRQYVLRVQPVSLARRWPMLLRDAASRHPPQLVSCAR
jgi:hypothetical protein